MLPCGYQQRNVHANTGRLKLISFGCLEKLLLLLLM